MADMELRPLGKSGIEVSAIAFGAWPISGVTSLGTTEADSVAALTTALDCGINHFDTAYCYGRDGESERLIARALGGRRSEIVIATKGGLHWAADGKMAKDGRPETLRRECDESLRRLGTDHVEMLYLHAPDPNVPVAESAGAIAELIAAGKALSAGISNATVAQLEEFQAVTPLAAFQQNYNMLQRGIEQDTLPWCRKHDVAVMAYWPLLKGLLAGKLPREHRFDPGDGRTKYPMFQGEEWQKNQDLLDRLREIAAEAGRSVAQLTINWTIHQPGITSALCGGKRADQVRENAGAAGWRLTETQERRIDEALAERGEAATNAAV